MHPCMGAACGLASAALTASIPLSGTREAMAVVCFSADGMARADLVALADSIVAGGRAWISVSALPSDVPALRACVTSHRTLEMGPHSFDPPHIKADKHCVLHRAEVEASTLCGCVRAPKQITDGHLGKLATANSAVLATLNENIPGSYLIPK